MLANTISAFRAGADVVAIVVHKITHQTHGYGEDANFAGITGTTRQARAFKSLKEA